MRRLNWAGWAIRQRMWNALMIAKFRLARPLEVPAPPPFEATLRPVPFVAKFPEVPIHAITVSDRVPEDEAQRVALGFCRVQTWLNRHAPPMQHGLPEVAPNPYDALLESYGPAYRRCFRVPYRPEGLGETPDLGVLAVASPYACYLQHKDGSYVWDLTSMKGPEVHGDVVPPWAHVTFARDPATGALAPTTILSPLGTSTPASADWDEATRLAVCAATTHLSLVRHFNWLHLIFGGPLAMSTRNCLPGGHPLRRVLHPHVYATQSSNQFVTYVQMDPRGDFESIFSYTHRGICELFEATREGFDLRMVNPGEDLVRRELGPTRFASPAYDNRSRLFEVFVRHARRYLELYYDDASIAADPGVARWLEQLRPLSPEGLEALLGDTVTLEGVTQVVASIIYMATVEHEIVDSGPWDYQLWFDVNPVRVYPDRRRPPVDLLHRVVNFNFNLQTPRTLLMKDFSSLALDARGAGAFRAFLGDLGALQRVLDTEPWAVWRLEPRLLRASINA